MNYNRYELVKIKKEGKVVVLTMDRPEALNAINPQLHDELENIFADVGRDDDIQAVVLTGSGRAFCAGGDVKGMDAREFDSTLGAGAVIRSAKRLIHNLLDIEQPIIAAVNGHAVGLGATLALFCDVIIASENAKFGDPHVTVGLVAGDGGAVIWPMLCGLAKAKEYLMTGDLLTATEAERVGLINHVVPQDEVMSKAIQLAQRLANGPSKAIRWTKLVCNKRLRDEVNLVLDASLAVESLSMLTEDHREATRAFIEKRAPRYKGR
ncbi:MAG: enoyl-CoA hydratase/isomerase family protein [Dehalococcoidia bacterium]|nr:MAG: enoyl-CoA hydratase/isomerase family protein [Dehalococcoidia bacterium]